MKLEKKNILIGLSVTAVIVLLGVAAFLLVRGIMQFNDSELKLQDAKKKLRTLYDGKPFPSQENIGKEKAKVNLICDWFKQLTTAMKSGQIEPDQKSTPSKFMSLLSSKKTELMSKANKSAKVLSDDFRFGFDRYLLDNSALPVPDDVPRLTQQLMIVEKLCGILFSEKIEQLSALQREEFEDGSVVLGGPGRPKSGSAVERLVNKNAGLMGAEDFFTKFRFIIEFKAKESAALNILDKIAGHEMFIVLVSVDIKSESSYETVVKENKDKKGKLSSPAAVDESAVKPAHPQGAKPRKAMTAEEKAEAGRRKAGGKPIAENPEEQDPKADIPHAPEEKPDREKRIVCGPEMEKAMKMKIEMDVYRFREE